MQFAPYTNPYTANTVVDPNLQPYRLTHFLPSPTWATPYNETPTEPPQVPWPNPTHNVSPRLGYMGNTAPDPQRRRHWIPTNSGAIDNVLTRYGANTTNPAQKNATVVNTVSGTIAYQVAANNYPAAGIFNYATTLDPAQQLRQGQTVDNPQNSVAGYADNGSQNSQGGLDVFRQPASFGLVADVSDHLPLIIEI